MYDEDDCLNRMIAKELLLKLIQLSNINFNSAESVIRDMKTLINHWRYIHAPE